jgi:hypothetical protein
MKIQSVMTPSGVEAVSSGKLALRVVCPRASCGAPMGESCGDRPTEPADAPMVLTRGGWMHGARMSRVAAARRIAARVDQS